MDDVTGCCHCCCCFWLLCVSTKAAFCTDHFIYRLLKSYAKEKLKKIWDSASLRTKTLLKQFHIKKRVMVMQFLDAAAMCVCESKDQGLRSYTRE
jgi:hypothetical protein